MIHLFLIKTVVFRFEIDGIIFDFKELSQEGNMGCGDKSHTHQAKKL
jgi:hypothetical protein